MGGRLRSFPLYQFRRCQEYHRVQKVRESHLSQASQLALVSKWTVFPSLPGRISPEFVLPTYLLSKNPPPHRHLHKGRQHQPASPRLPRQRYHGRHPDRLLQLSRCPLVSQKGQEKLSLALRELTSKLGSATTIPGQQSLSSSPLGKTSMRQLLGTLVNCIGHE